MASEAARPAAGHEFDFSSRDFERVRAMIRQRAGIALNASKRSMVYSRLARELRAANLSSFSDYLDKVEDGTLEEQGFVNALTTNLTSFFRESHHFPVLADCLRTQPRNAPVRLWCCAASTGEEPYSIAITAIETLGTDRPPVQIVATDIDTNVLATAQRGVYRRDAVAGLSREQLQRHFQRGTGSNDGLVRVRPEVRALVSFQPLNLLDPRWSVQGRFTAIFCRNVMIYFDKPTQLAILQRFVPMLERRGLLFVGHSENFTRATAALSLEGKTVYRKVDAS